MTGLVAGAIGAVVWIMILGFLVALLITLAVAGIISHFSGKSFLIIWLSIIGMAISAVTFTKSLVYFGVYSNVLIPGAVCAFFAVAFGFFVWAFFDCLFEKDERKEDKWNY